MEKIERQFLTLEQVAAVLGVSLKMLRARVDTRTGMLDLGGGGPSLRSVKLGRLRMVSRVVFERWLSAVSGEDVPSIDPQGTQLPMQRRGRPRKSAATGEMA